MLKGRLLAIANAVPPSRAIADIGTDHGLVPVWLVTNGIAQKAIITDISPGSLAKAESLIKQEGLADKIEPRLGDGLLPVKPGEVDTIVIAGMGGMLIKSILESAPYVTARAETFVLQPMTAQSMLRKWLNENGYAIVDEILVREGSRFYEIITAAHGSQYISDEIYYDISYMLIKKKDPLLKDFIRQKIERTTDIILHLEKQDTKNSEYAAREFRRKLLQYKEVYRWVFR